MSDKEIVIASTNELKNGEMKTVYTDDGDDYLLVRLDDRFYVLEAYCPHYGAPLEMGIVSEKKIMCPWHHAKLMIETGAVDAPPALSGLKTFKVEVRGEDVVLFPGQSAEKKETSKPSSAKEKDDRTFIIIGGGAAGNSASLTLREQGFEGHLIMITADSQPPYDRTTLSKDFMKGDMEDAWLPLTSQDFYEKNKIELILEKSIISVDATTKTVQLENKSKLDFDKLLVATGGEPRMLDVPGTDLKNIFLLRTVDNARRILEAADTSKTIAVVGASFIAMETAENLTREGREIHVIAPESLPFGPTLGEDFGRLIMEKKEKDGIHFHLGHSVKEFRGNGTLNELVLDNDETLTADMAVVGIGVNPATAFMPQFDKVKDGSLLTDEYLQVENDVFAAGDIATFPYWKTNDLIRIEHWRVAEQQGRVAAKNMLGMKEKLEIIPFFWLNLAGMHVRYVGHAGEWDDITVHGDLEKEGFIIYYTGKDTVKAALGVNRDEHMALIEELLRLDKMPSAEEMKKEILSRDDLAGLI